MSVTHSFKSTFLWVGYAVATLLLGVWLSWQISAQANFFYSHWYHALNIDLAVETYAPKHNYKAGFEQTTDAERQRLFSEIVQAVQNDGEGLGEIRYYDSQGEAIDTLLTKDEVIHLQDVANLIAALNHFALWLFAACVLFLLVAKMRLYAMPSLSKLLIGIVAGVFASVLTVMLIGPVKVFYWLHTKVFPDDHQWFFYYEDSLMSLLMKAPILFGPIAIQLMLVALVLWWVHLLVVKMLFRSPAL